MSIVKFFTRRRAVTLLLALLLAVGVMSAAGLTSAHAAMSTGTTNIRVARGTRPGDAEAVAAFGQLEAQYGATLGVYALDTGTGRTVAYHADQRFAFCSTIKVFASGVLLRRDTNAQLSRVITYGTSELQAYSPITSQHVTTGMRLDALISAALQYSDNTAANLLLAQLGGPRGLQRALRALGDKTIKVNRDEPSLNTAIPGDSRDTSTARALATGLRRFVLGDLLSPSRKQDLTEQLVGNTTGGPFVRSGVPVGWKVGDKTGSGDYGTRNDIAVVWPPHRRPIVIALLSHRGEQDSTSMDALLADATKAVLADIN